MVRLVPQVELKVFTLDGKSNVVEESEVFKGPIAWGHKLVATSIMFFPIANYAVRRNEYHIYKLDKKQYKDFKARLEAKDDIPIDREVSPRSRIVADGDCALETAEGSYVLGMEATLGRRSKVVKEIAPVSPMPWQNTHYVEIEFKNKDDYKEWVTYDIDLKQGNNLPDGHPEKGVLLPRCKLCDRFMNENIRPGLYGAKSDAIPPWWLKFTCGACITTFADMFDFIRQSFTSSFSSEPLVSWNCLHLLGLAERGTRDPLAIAAAKTYLASCAQTYLANYASDEDTLSLFEEAKEFLVQHGSDAFKDAGFASDMKKMYLFNIFLLGQHYLKSKQVEKAIPLFEEGLRADEEMGEELNIAKSKDALGNAYAMLKNYVKAEELLVDSYNRRRKIPNGNASRPLVMLIGIYLDTMNKEGLKVYLPQLKAVFGGNIPSDPLLRALIQKADSIIR